MSVIRKLVGIGLLSLAACSSDGGDGSADPVPTPEPASLSVTAPGAKVVVPKCLGANIELTKAGSDLGCGVVCPTLGDTCTVVCQADKGLMSVTPCDLAVVYTVAGSPVARAGLGSVTLSAGANELQVKLADVVQVDANQDGTPDAQVLCR